MFLLKAVAAIRTVCDHICVFGLSCSRVAHERFHQVRVEGGKKKPFLLRRRCRRRNSSQLKTKYTEEKNKSTGVENRPPSSRGYPLRYKVSAVCFDKQIYVLDKMLLRQRVREIGSGKLPVLGYYVIQLIESHSCESIISRRRQSRWSLASCSANMRMNHQRESRFWTRGSLARLSKSLRFPWRDRAWSWQVVLHSLHRSPSLLSDIKTLSICRVL